MKRIILLLMLIALLMLTGCSCKHSETKLVNAIAATCTEAGYSGDTYCAKCSEKLSDGEVVPVFRNGNWAEKFC